MANIKLDIVTAERSVFSDEVDEITAPGIEGQFTLLPNHAPFMTLLLPGELIIRKNREELPLAVTGGFLENHQNTVTILADAAERVDEIDTARAEEAKKRAQEQITHGASQTDIAVAEASLRRSITRLKVAQRKTRKPPP